MMQKTKKILNVVTATHNIHLRTLIILFFDDTIIRFLYTERRSITRQSENTEGKFQIHMAKI